MLDPLKWRCRTFLWITKVPCCPQISACTSNAKGLIFKGNAGASKLDLTSNSHIPICVSGNYSLPDDFEQKVSN